METKNIKLTQTDLSKKASKQYSGSDYVYRVRADGVDDPTIYQYLGNDPTGATFESIEELDQYLSEEYDAFMAAFEEEE